MFESRIEELCVGTKRFMPQTLQINRQLRDWMLCELDGKDYWEEKRKQDMIKKKDDLRSIDIINWMRQH